MALSWRRKAASLGSGKVRSAFQAAYWLPHSVSAQLKREARNTDRARQVSTLYVVQVEPDAVCH